MAFRKKALLPILFLLSLQACLARHDLSSEIEFEDRANSKAIEENLVRAMEKQAGILGGTCERFTRGVGGWFPDRRGPDV